MSFVPLEKMTGVRWEDWKRDFKAGPTSGKVERELYASMREAVEASSRESEDSTKAWLRELRVMVEKGSYCSLGGC